MTIVEAIQAGDLEALRSELKSDAALANAKSPEGVPVLRLAAYFRFENGILALREAGAVPDLHTAATLGDPLPEGDVHDYSTDGWTPLHLAAFFGRTENVKALLARGASVSARSTNQLANLPIHAAAAGRHSAAVQLLIDAGSPVNETQQGGYVPLHSAAQSGDIETARILLAAGANPKLPTGDGKTPIDIAHEKGFAELVRLLEA